MTTEVLSVQARTAIDDTKRGYGLWRGEVLHPASPRVAAALASGEPITDTKGLGLRYVPVRGGKVIPHFRVHDPEKFSAALDRAFPAVHDAVVRLVAEDVRAGGFAALERWCAGASLPKRFDVAGVHVEKPCVEDAVRYRPDIAVEHPAGGRVELEVVNTHAPESARLEAAWGAGHIVLSLRIRDLVEALVFSEGRGLVPDDETLRGLLKGRRFALCGRESVPREVQVVWRDLNLAAYCEDISAGLKTAWRKHRYELSEVSFMLGGGNRGDTDDSVKPRCERAYDMLYPGWDRGPSGFDSLWYTPLLAEIKRACAPDPEFLTRLRDAENFLTAFEHATALTASTQAARKLRYRLAAMARIKRWELSWMWGHVSEIVADDARKIGWNRWPERNLGHKNMPSFMQNLRGE